MKRRLRAIQLRGLLQRVPLVAKAVGLAASSALALGGVYAVVADQPTQLAGGSYIGLSYTCPNDTELYVATTPSVDIQLADNGFDASFGGAIFSQGKGSCAVYLTIPGDAVAELPSDPARGTMSTEPSKSVFSPFVAVGVAPPYTDNWRSMPNSVMTYAFASHESVGRSGWGRHQFTFTAGVVESRDGVTAFPAGAPPDGRSYDINVTCKYGDTAANSFPSGATQDSPDVLTWQVPEQFFPRSYSGTCENMAIRFWVGHATDAITLGVGAVLGFLVTLTRKEENRSNTVEDVAQPSRMSQRAESSTSRIGYVATVRRQRLWPFAVVMFLAIWLYRHIWRPRV